MQWNRMQCNERRCNTTTTTTTTSITPTIATHNTTIITTITIPIKNNLCNAMGFNAIQWTPMECNGLPCYPFLCIVIQSNAMPSIPMQ